MYVIVKGSKTDEDEESEKEPYSVAAYKEMKNKKPKDYIDSLYAVNIPTSQFPIFHVRDTGM